MGIRRGDIRTNLIILIAVFLSIILLFNGILSASKLSENSEQKQKEIYNSQMLISYDFISETSWSGDDEIIVEGNHIEELNLTEGNLIFKGYKLFIGGTYNPIYADILLVQNEDLVEGLEIGRYATDEELENNIPVVIIGKGLEHYAIEENNKKYISIESEKYEVVGVLKDNTSGNLDDRLIINYESLSENKRNEVNYSFSNPEDGIYNFNLLYGSNMCDVENNKVIIEEWTTGLGGLGEYEYISNYYVEEDTYIDYVSELVVKLNVYTIRLLYIFSLINCIVVSNIWIKQRKKEFIIRKAFGENMGSITKLIVGGLGNIIATAFVLAIFVELIYVYVSRQSEYWWKYFNQNILYLAIGIILILGTVSLIPIMQVWKISPNQGLRDL